jgi:hypothetical protein
MLEDRNKPIVYLIFPTYFTPSSCKYFVSHIISDTSYLCSSLRTKDSISQQRTLFQNNTIGCYIINYDNDNKSNKTKNDKICGSHGYDYSDYSLCSATNSLLDGYQSLKEPTASIFRIHWNITL